MSRADYLAFGGHADAVRPIEAIRGEIERRLLVANDAEDGGAASSGSADRTLGAPPPQPR